MKKSNTAFLTTIFPASESYLDEFFTSLESQTINDFDILLVNDGIKNFQYYEKKYPSLNIIELNPEGSPVKNRELAINKALDFKYDYLVFGDSDDFFSKNRIELSVNALKDHDIVYNDLTIFNTSSKTESFFSKFIKPSVNIYESFLDSNVFGLSNIAIKANIVKRKIEFDKSLIAIDWFFISSLLVEYHRSIFFLIDAVTYYRQHQNNTIGLSLKLDNEKLKIGLNVKTKHYSSLNKYCLENKIEKYAPIFEEKLKLIQELKTEFQDPSFKKKYILLVNSVYEKIFTGWWSEIITKDDFYKYENSNK